MFSAIRLAWGSYIRGSKVFAILIVFLIFVCHIERGAGDFSVNCKTKIRNMWLRYCVSDGVRLKRDVSETEKSNYRHPARASRIRSEIPAEKPVDFSLPENTGLGFTDLVSGVDLSFGLSHGDIEDLWQEISQRTSRAARDKEQTIKMITDYASKCCNENLQDATCSDPANVINCP